MSNSLTWKRRDKSSRHSLQGSDRIQDHKIIPDRTVKLESFAGVCDYIPISLFLSPQTLPPRARQIHCAVLDLTPCMHVPRHLSPQSNVP